MIEIYAANTAIESESAERVSSSGAESTYKVVVHCNYFVKSFARSRTCYLLVRDRRQLMMAMCITV